MISPPKLDSTLDKVKRETIGQDSVLRNATGAKNLANLSSLRIQSIELAVILLRGIKERLEILSFPWTTRAH